MAHFRPAWLKTACSRQTRRWLCYVLHHGLSCPPASVPGWVHTQEVWLTCISRVKSWNVVVKTPERWTAGYTRSRWAQRPGPDPPSVRTSAVCDPHHKEAAAEPTGALVCIHTHTHTHMGQTQPLCPAWSNVSSSNQRTLCCAATSSYLRCSRKMQRCWLWCWDEWIP